MITFGIQTTYQSEHYHSHHTEGELKFSKGKQLYNITELASCKGEFLCQVYWILKHGF